MVCLRPQRCCEVGQACVPFLRTTVHKYRFFTVELFAAIFRFGLLVIWYQHKAPSSRLNPRAKSLPILAPSNPENPKTLRMRKRKLNQIPFVPTCRNTMLRVPQNHGCFQTSKAWKPTTSLRWHSNSITLCFLEDRVAEHNRPVQGSQQPPTDGPYTQHPKSETPNPRFGTPKSKKRGPSCSDGVDRRASCSSKARRFFIRQTRYHLQPPECI